MKRVRIHARRSLPMPRHFAALALVAGAFLHADSVARILVSQESARPGDSISIKVRGQRVLSDEPIRAVFAKNTLGAARVTGEGHIEVIVPSLPVGESTVALYQGRRLLGRRQLAVRDSLTRRLAISYHSDGVELLRSSPASGRPTGHVRSRRHRVSFDLINERGAVVYSGTMLDPTMIAGEVITQASDAGGPARLGHGPVSPNGVIFVNIPNPPGYATLRVYRADPNLDLFTADGRAGRRLIGSLEVGP